MCWVIVNFVQFLKMNWFVDRDYLVCDVFLIIDVDFEDVMVYGDELMI